MSFTHIREATLRPSTIGFPLPENLATASTTSPSVIAASIRSFFPTVMWSKGSKTIWPNSLEGIFSSRRFVASGLSRRKILPPPDVPGGATAIENHSGNTFIAAGASVAGAFCRLESIPVQTATTRASSMPNHRNAIHGGPVWRMYLDPKIHTRVACCFAESLPKTGRRDFSMHTESTAPPGQQTSSPKPQFCGAHPPRPRV